MIYKNVHYARCARSAAGSLDNNVVIRVEHFQDFERSIESKRLVSIYYVSLDLDLCFELWLLYNILIKYYNISHILDYIDVGDGCLRQFVLATTLRCC